MEIKENSIQKKRILKLRKMISRLSLRILKRESFIKNIMKKEYLIESDFHIFHYRRMIELYDYEIIILK